MTIEKGTKFDADKLDLSLLPPGWPLVLTAKQTLALYAEDVFRLVYEATSNTADRFQIRRAAGTLLQHVADPLQWDITTEVVKVLEFGVRKYSRDNWQLVPNAVIRYRAAARRHLDAIMWRHLCNELRAQDDVRPLYVVKADDSDCYHWAHVVVNLLFLLWFDERAARGEVGP